MNPSVSPRHYKLSITEPHEESPLTGKIKLLRHVAASLSQAVDELEQATGHVPVFVDTFELGRRLVKVRQDLLYPAGP